MGRLKDGIDQMLIPSLGLLKFSLSAQESGAQIVNLILHLQATTDTHAGFLLQSPRRCR
jgi:hypothetical protein